ncbi:MAG: hypothetical protein WA021_03360 [Minisyncoccia bacterium]
MQPFILATALFLLGSLTGLGIFSLAYDKNYYVPPVSGLYRFNGTIATHDATARNFVVATPDNFSESGTKQARFSYDEGTEWWSMEYGLQDETLVRRRVAAEQARPLPAGTMISVYRDESSDDFHASLVMFMRKSAL